MCTVLSQGITKKTRKRHRCAVCDRWIEIGSMANWQVNVSDDWGFAFVRWHMDCDIRDIEE